MKHITLTCNFCCEEIKQEDKFHTFNVPVYIDFDENKVIREEYHFCEHCYNWRLHTSLSEYELELRKKFNDYMAENKWKM